MTIVSLLLGSAFVQEVLSQTVKICLVDAGSAPKPGLPPLLSTPPPQSLPNGSQASPPGTLVLSTPPSALPPGISEP